jgi:hypothetical protein
MRLTDAQHALLAERLAEKMMDGIDGRTMERMVYDMYLDEYMLMDEEDLLVEADMYEVEVPSALVV